MQLSPFRTDGVVHATPLPIYAGADQVVLELGTKYIQGVWKM